ncbi:MAG: HU family DNA-binding protein [Patescibacteria group bacterium]|nr:HU family DNA-binding protein [Patescibacteria group bacterium]
MTKTQLVDMVAEVSGTTKAAAGRSVDAVVESVTKALAKGEKVVLTGFGTFEVRRRAARMGRNPQTGAPLHIAATKTPAFKAGKALKDAVR